MTTKDEALKRTLTDAARYFDLMDAAIEAAHGIGAEHEPR